MTARPAVVRRAQYLMIAGLLTSFIGSEVIEGAATGLVALGVLPVIWVPLYSTVTDLQDSLAASVAKMVEKRDPGAVLVACELADVGLSLVAITLILILGQSHIALVLVGYLLIASILPLIVDLAEEFYLNDIGQVDAQLVLRANTIISVATAIAGLMLARPVGALVSSTGITVILGINIAFSFLAVILRWRSTETFHPQHVLEDEDDEEPEGLLASIKDFLLPHSPRHVFKFGVLSPVFSFFLSLAPAMIATYMLLWLANSGESPLLRLGSMLFVMGLIQAFTPMLMSRLMRKVHGRGTVRLLSIFLVVVLGAYLTVLAVIIMLPNGPSRFFIVLAGLIVAASSVWCVRFAISTLRQSCLTQAEFRTVVGWSYSLTAIGGIVGSWLGYTLKTDSDPRASLLCAAITMAGLVAWLLVKRVTLPAEVSSSC